MINEIKKRLGWALLVWTLCGLGAFGIFTAGAIRFTPELAHVPADWVMWTLDAALLVLCMLGGPLAVLGALLLFLMVGFFTWLIG